MTEPSGPADVYAGLRNQVLSLTPEQIGAPDVPVLALLMETGYAEAVATLVAVVDGTTSLYFSNGGGIIGAGAHETVALASRAWLETGAELLELLSAATDPPPPAQGVTQFVAVTPTGLRGGSALEAELAAGGQALSPLFYAGQNVITQIRLVEGG